MRALVVKPHRLSATGFLGERLLDRGFELEELVASEDGVILHAAAFDAVVVMGAPWSVYGETVAPWIDGVLDLLRGAHRDAVPVLGVCFGAQAIAAAFGAEVRHAGAVELGWQLVETVDPSLVPAGPWFMWHSDTFDLPEGATEVARTSLGPQAFTFGPHVCVQFHPEAVAEIVRAWIEHDDADLSTAGV